MRNLLILMFAVITSCARPAQHIALQRSEMVIDEPVIVRTIEELREKQGKNALARMEKGVRHAASLWRANDGSAEDFVSFSVENYISDEAERDLVFQRFSDYYESLYGNFIQTTLALRKHVDLDTGPLHNIDRMFNAYWVGAHWQDDFYKNKIAFLVALNFPYYSLEEKDSLGKTWSRKEWAEARVGDIFIARVPAELEQAYNEATSQAGVYVSEYNIKMGQLLTNDGKKLFPEDMSLLSHWNLRDEIKANYAKAEDGIEKQEMIYMVMKRIINQEIPEMVINQAGPEWNPYENFVLVNGEKVDFKTEPDTRYQHLLDNFIAAKNIDPYYPTMETFIKRSFSGAMEIPQEQVEATFDEFLRSPQLKKIGAIIEQRLGRKLKPYDIWYDGFKSRSAFNEDDLTAKTTRLYPDANAFERDIPNLLKKLGWNADRADYIASKIAVDAARGSGHAWGAAMRGMKSRLRTRIPETGLDYKGYNIAMHELGHNVEQTISLYDVEHYALNGVPNTAFTEALAFMFQKRDLQLLGLIDSSPEKEMTGNLDAAWSLMEIMGVGMVDMKVWKWLYEHPEANAGELKNAVVEISREVWNTYFAPVFGVEDEPLLAIYSHMIAYPLYLWSYSYGKIIEFQLEGHLAGKHFANEIDRIYKIGRLTPNRWMEEAAGANISALSVLKAIK
jgi:hypothetical protein